MQAEIIKQQLQTPDDFQFPFTPYPIQNEFMQKLYFVMEEGKLGIFESPTGTVSNHNNAVTINLY